MVQWSKSPRKNIMGLGSRQQLNSVGGEGSLVFFGRRDSGHWFLYPR